MNKKKSNRNILLKGEGINQHVLHGEATITSREGGFDSILLHEDGRLSHETPEGAHAEHETLPVTKGEWIMGQQVEFDPFERVITRVWD
jgi:hypothetical protein